MAEWTDQIVTIDSLNVRLKTDQPRRYVGVPGMKAIAQHFGADLRVGLEMRIVRLASQGRSGTVWWAFSRVLVLLPAPRAAESFGDHRWPTRRELSLHVLIVVKFVHRLLCRIAIINTYDTSDPRPR